MRIGIITTKFNNYGSKLQNIASVELLKKEFPHSKIQTLIISRPKKCFFLFYILNKIGVYGFIYKLFKFKGKLNSNNKLINYKIFVMKKTDATSLDFLNKKYDLFVFGSDQIWNYVDADADFKFGLFTEKKICNAPSLIVTKNFNASFFTKYLKTFNSLNVREEKTAKFISEKLALECKVLKDPTLRLEKKTWEELVSKVPIYQNNYIFVYILNNKALFNEIVDKFENEKIISIFQENNGKDSFDYSPLEFVKLVSMSKKVVTNSFHGACFATIFNKQLSIITNNNESDCRFDVFDDYKNKEEYI